MADYQVTDSEYFNEKYFDPCPHCDGQGIIEICSHCLDEIDKDSPCGCPKDKPLEAECTFCRGECMVDRRGYID
jgi:hypothetical protein